MPLKLGLLIEPATETYVGKEPDDPYYTRATLILKMESDLSMVNTNTIVFPRASVDWLPIRGIAVYDDGGVQLMFENMYDWAIVRKDCTVELYPGDLHILRWKKRGKDE